MVSEGAPSLAPAAVILWQPPPSTWSPPLTRWWSRPWRILVLHTCTWDGLTSLFESQGDRAAFSRGTTGKRGQGRVLGALESGAQD